MSSPEEIWSVRLQREILALTEEGEKAAIGILPPFIEVQDTKLDIQAGHCSVAFAVTVEGVECGDRERVSVSKDKIDSQLGEADEESEEKDNDNNNDNAGDDVAEEAKETIEEDTTGDKNTKEIQDTTDDAEANTDAGKTVANAEEKFKVQVIVTLDASLTKRQSAFSASSSYPFFKPTAILTSGASHLPKSTNVKDGDQIHIDCDWTPSLHLNDAAMNIALKVRESIKRGEPCLRVVPPPRKDESLLDEVAADLSAGANKVASFFSDLKTKASAVAEELDHAVGNAKANHVDANANSESSGSNLRSPGLKRQNFRPKGFRRKKDNTEVIRKKVVTMDNIEIGDDINLAENPWNKAVGLFPCNAIRRPEFIEASMLAAGLNAKSTKVAGAGISGAGSVFRSFTKSAKSLVEESFLMLTEELILEIKCNKFSVANATVSFAIPVSHLAKLKFRREESISLFFKQAPEDPIIYMCASSADAVKQIQNILKRHGVRGKHTNATMAKTVQIALQMIEDIKVMEEKLEESPSREQVTIIMDLYRQAAEKFELAGDARHEEVMAHMRDFLAKPHVASILDGTFEEKEASNASVSNDAAKESVKEASNISPKQPVEEQVTNSDATEVQKAANTTATDKQEINTEPVVPQGEVFESPTDEPIDGGGVGDEGLEKAMQEAEDMIKDAHADLKDLGLDDIDGIDDDDDFDLPSTYEGSSKSAADEVTDTVSELEDMLKDADKELQELMKD